MATKKIKIKASLEQEGVLQDIIYNAEFSKEAGLLLKKIRYDLSGADCLKLYISPYCRKYGMERCGLLNTLLESYHQLRLNDKK